ncbi:terminase small subunit [Piscirickettsia litoralis]|uniref:Terminase n=1 Tax=Piscirickettsia litoralis TaxID=1891921 RepID=A0ABX2ZWE4_9GAMM|nr:terminase small subunit [Piscirickettsia litoralis]ODN40932.1 hypothetical protein BGC07_18895 [Piscirickettsia litoralis]
MGKLSPKKERFVEEYLIDLNATQAAIRAGYSEKTANKQGPKLLVNVGIQEEIQKRQEKLKIKAEEKQLDVIQSYVEIARTSITDVLSWKDSKITIKDSDCIPPEIARCISEITEEKSKFGSKLKIKMYDRKSSLDSLARHFGLFNQKTETEITLNPQTAMEKLTEQLFKVKENDKQNSDDN